MTVEFREEKDKDGNVIAMDVEISAPTGMDRGRYTQSKLDFEPLECKYCHMVLGYWDGHDIFGDYICPLCWSKKPDEWEEECT